MDTLTENHFQTWLTSTVCDADRDQVETGIRALVAGYPDLLDRMSWPEMRDLVERNARKGIK